MPHSNGSVFSRLSCQVVIVLTYHDRTNWPISLPLWNSPLHGRSLHAHRQPLRRVRTLCWNAFSGSRLVWLLIAAVFGPLWLAGSSSQNQMLVPLAHVVGQH